MTEKRAETGNPANIGAEQDAAKHDHHRTLASIQYQGQGGEGLVAGAQDIGGTDIAGTDLADIALTGHAGQDQAERR